MVTGTGSVAIATSNLKNDVPSVDSSLPQRRASDNRRSNKPIMEKRRRARINNCLNELKTLILDAMKKDPARHSKLEKADILEMTVKHLENLQRQQVAMSAATDPAVLNKFRAGFTECAGEVGKFPGLDPIVKRRLLQHLANCLSSSTQINKNQQIEVSQNTAVQVHILPTPSSTEVPTVATQNGIIFSQINGNGVQLVPTRLANGDIALVLPTTVPQTHLYTQIQSPSSSPNVSSTSGSSPVPMLVPIPQRTASTASAASSTSSGTYEHISPSNLERDSLSSSPEPMDTHYEPPAQKPLSLVIRKSYEHEEEKPWRPW